LSGSPRRFFAIVNPAAGGGRSGKLAPAALGRLRAGLGVDTQVEIVHTERAGQGTELAREAYKQGFRNFLAVGGDGTSFEIVNGVFPESLAAGGISLGFLPLGTGNSFLRDFTSEGAEQSIRAIGAGQSRRCDVIRTTHADGELFFINVMCLGFPADVGELTNRKYKGRGELSYILAVFAQLSHLQYETFPHRTAAAGDWDRRPCTFLAFTNSKFTGGKMMIAPLADATDGLIECVRWGPIGRLRLVWNFPTLFTGSHIHHPLASRAAARRVDFDLPGPVITVIDGEILRLNLRSLEILPGALDVMI
jgi:diacylglycerol kinase (ATP)